jgi:hypothetical protein
VRVTGPVEELLATHHLLTGPRRRGDQIGQQTRHGIPGWRVDISFLIQETIS